VREDGRGAQLGTNLRRELDALRLGNRLARGESTLRHHNRRNVAVDISDICNIGGVINVDRPVGSNTGWGEQGYKGTVTLEASAIASEAQPGLPCSATPVLERHGIP